MSANLECPKSFFVDIFMGDSVSPMRELVHFSPGSGLTFNSAFVSKYWYLAFGSSAFVDRDSSPWLSFFDRVFFDSLCVSWIPIRSRVSRSVPGSGSHPLRIKEGSY